MEEGGISLTEVNEQPRPHEPGIAYDDEYEYNDLKRRQAMEAEPSLREDYDQRMHHGHFKDKHHYKRNPFY